MISFRNDYSEGAHPSVLEALSRAILKPPAATAWTRFVVMRRTRSEN